MKPITFYLDFVSPYAYLAFERLPHVLQGLSYAVTYKPVVLGALFKAHQNPGPAGIAVKREWTMRHVQWLAQHEGVPLQLPAAHPFNPLPLLRLALASGTQEQPNRYICEAIFRHVWQGDGAEANDALRMQALIQTLAPVRDFQGAQVKALLKQNTDEALAHSAFGAPSFVVDDKLFWGFDALPMLRAYLAGDDWFNGPQWAAATQLPRGM